MSQPTRTTYYKVESHRRSTGANKVRKITRTTRIDTAHRFAKDASVEDGIGAHVIISSRVPGDRWRIVGSYENGVYRAAAT